MGRRNACAAAARTSRMNMSARCQQNVSRAAHECFCSVNVPTARYPAGMPPLDLDLSRTSVFLDFDGTVSTRDVGIHLLERAGSDGWWALHEEYERGEIGSRECMYDQWALVEGDEAHAARHRRRGAARSGLRAAGATTFVPRGAEITVVSDGFGFYVRGRVRTARARGAHERGRLRDARVAVSPRGPLLPVLHVRRVQAGADQGREVPRADHGAHRRRRERPQGRAARRRRVRQGLARRLVHRVRRRHAARSRRSTTCAPR